MLAFPTQTGEFILDTDASHSSIGAVLSQIQEGQEKVIAYASNKLSKTERFYCVTRKELLAVYYYVYYYVESPIISTADGSAFARTIEPSLGC